MQKRNKSTNINFFSGYQELFHFCIRFTTLNFFSSFSSIPACRSFIGRHKINYLFKKLDKYFFYFYF